jgi:hypothetical protein
MVWRHFANIIVYLNFSESELVLTKFPSLSPLVLKESSIKIQFKEKFLCFISTSDSRMNSTLLDLILSEFINLI